MVSYTRTRLSSLALLASLFAFAPAVLAESKEDVSTSSLITRTSLAPSHLHYACLCSLETCGALQGENES